MMKNFTLNWLKTGATFFSLVQQTDEELELLRPMLEKKLGIFSTQNNDTDVLLNQV